MAFISHTILVARFSLEKERVYKRIYIIERSNNIIVQETLARFLFDIMFDKRGWLLLLAYLFHFKTVKLRSPARQNKNNNNNNIESSAAHKNRDAYDVTLIVNRQKYPRIISRRRRRPPSLRSMYRAHVTPSLDLCQARTTRMSSGVRTARGPVNWVMKRSRAQRIWYIASSNDDDGDGQGP